VAGSGSRQSAAGWRLVTAARKRPAQRCSWHDCTQPAAATVAFKLPNLLTGSRRDYCAAHTTQVRMAKGTVVVARFSLHQPALSGLSDAPPGRRRGHRRKEVMP
jgi:hypothetical protein